MRQRSRPYGRAALVAAGGTLGIAANLGLGGCMLEEIVAPAEAMELSPEGVNVEEVELPPGQNRALAGLAESPGPELQSLEAELWLESEALPPVARVEVAGTGTARIIVCTRNPSDYSERPLILVDGVQTDADFDDIAALEIESFEIVKNSDAIAEYGEAAQHGVILILTKNPDNE